MMVLTIVPAIVGLGLFTLGLFGSSRFLTPESVWGGGSAHAATGSAMPISCRDRMRTASRTEDTPFLDLDFAHRRRSEEHTSELQSLMRSSYAVLCLKKKSIKNTKSAKTTS